MTACSGLSYSASDGCSGDLAAATRDSSSELDRDGMDVVDGARGAGDVDSWARWDGVAGLGMWLGLVRATGRRKERAKSGRRRAVATVRVDNIARGHRLRIESGRGRGWPYVHGRPTSTRTHRKGNAKVGRGTSSCV